MSTGASGGSSSNVVKLRSRSEHQSMSGLTLESQSYPRYIWCLCNFVTSTLSMVNLPLILTFIGHTKQAGLLLFVLLSVYIRVSGVFIRYVRHPWTFMKSSSIQVRPHPLSTKV